MMLNYLIYQINIVVCQFLKMKMKIKINKIIQKIKMNKIKRLRKIIFLLDICKMILVQAIMQLEKRFMNYIRI